MTGQFLAEVHAGDGCTTVHLGGVLVASPRLALRWLRGQAERLANGLDPDPTTLWIPPHGLQPTPALASDAPTDLRGWAADDGRQAEALQRLATRAEFEFFARDETCWYGLTARPLLTAQPLLTARPLLTAEAVRAPGTPPTTP